MSQCRLVNKNAPGTIFPTSVPMSAMPVTMMSSPMAPLSTPMTLTQQLTNQGVPSDLAQQYELYSNLPAVSPEPFGILINILSASQYVEKAIHSCDKKDILKYLCKGQKSLTYALNYANNGNYPALTSQITMAGEKLQSLQDKISQADRAQIPLIQQEDIYNFQGDLSALQDTVNKL